MFFDGSVLVGEPALTLPNQRLSLHWLSQLLTKSSTDFSSSLVLQIESSAKLRSWESVWRLECWMSTLILATEMMRAMLKSDEDEEGWNYPRQFPPPRPNLCSFPGKLHQISQQISNISQHELEVQKGFCTLSLRLLRRSFITIIVCVHSHSMHKYQWNMLKQQDLLITLNVFFRNPASKVVKGTLHWSANTVINNFNFKVLSFWVTLKRKE